MYTLEDSNIRKTWILMALFLCFVIALGFAFGYVFQNQAILYFAVIFSLTMNVLSYWYSDRIALKISGARPTSREEHRELWNVVENLSITAGLPMPKLYIIDDPSPNAFATGRNKENAAVAVTVGLLRRLEKSELEGVIAHELAHIGNRDILLSTVVVVLVGFIALLSDFFLRMSFWGGGRRNDDNRVAVFAVIIGVALAILSPIAATLIQLAVSRKREFLADATGALLTRYPEGLARALEKISEYGEPLRRVNNATAHLWISDPHGKKLGAMAKLFMTHPPIEERIARLRNTNL